jgi:probable rRNA maturation factor
MTCTVTVHDHVGRERLAAAVEPLDPDVAVALFEAAIAEAARAAVGNGRDVEVELTLCADGEMERLNFDHMGERGPTDVLGFPLHEWEIEDGRSHLADDDGAGPLAPFGSPGGPLLLGDVVVDLDQALRQAAEGGWSVAEEVVLLAIHGTLHLLGHDHAELADEEEMRAVERRALASLHRRHREVKWRPGSLFDRAGHAVSSGA